jgi:hypothetical protein
MLPILLPMTPGPLRLLIEICGGIARFWRSLPEHFRAH